MLTLGVEVFPLCEVWCTRSRMERHPRYAPPVSAELPKLGRRQLGMLAPSFNSTTTISKWLLAMAARSMVTVTV